MRGFIIRVIISLVGVAIWLSAGAMIEDVSTRRIVTAALRDALIFILIGLWVTFLIFRGINARRTECNRSDAGRYYENAATAYAIAGLMMLCYPTVMVRVLSMEALIREAVCEFTFSSASVVSLVALGRMLLSGTRKQKVISLVGAVLPVLNICLFIMEYTVWLPAFVAKQ